MIQPSISLLISACIAKKYKQNELANIFLLNIQKNLLNHFSFSHQCICFMVHPQMPLRALEIQLFLKTIFYSTSVTQISLQVTDILKLTACVNANTI